MKRIAALTMVRNDVFFLRKWVEYYGAQLGRENLYVLLDGLDQCVPDFCAGVNVIKEEHVDADVKVGDKRRIGIVSDLAGSLLGRYDMVIGTDVDEFLIVDPSLGQGLVQFLSRKDLERYPCLSGLGVDVGQNLNEEKEISEDFSFLSQRSYAKLSTRYTKASVLSCKAQWGSGFHRVKGHNFHIVKDLYLFHFGCVDMERLKMKMGDKGLLADGWTRHLKKRAGTIHLVSTHKACGWDGAVHFARMCQTIVRPPYAWNKPAMFELRIVVGIPDRFKEIV